MTDRWQRIERIYHEALEHAAPARQAFVERECGGDVELAREVQSLLRHAPFAESFLEQPPALTPRAGLRIGQRLGPYEITAMLGAGGMGEVYRARDARLRRDVAVKVLPEILASERDYLARFDREAHLLASLNHPNIAAVYGLEESDGIRALVIELVEGPTLAERISAGPVPLNEALSIAKQIAEALEAAHARGVVHRDLKPANIKLTRDGQVKVLDFGLAKLLDPDVGAAQVTAQVTTHAGVILGTAAYMSPEQARGLQVDKRTDVWAFGCVLYEMLTGRGAFEGDTAVDVLANVTQLDPDWARLPVRTPDSVRVLLRRCLEKSSAKRLRDIGDAHLEIDEAIARPLTQAPASPMSVQPVAILTAAGIALMALAAGAAYYARTPDPAREIRLDVITPPTSDVGSFALAPDGRSVLFVATAQGQPTLFLRTLDSEVARPLVGTEGASYPFWSPDGRSIGFFAAGKLKRLDFGDGAVHVLADAPLARGGAWNAENTIVFCPDASTTLFRVSSVGGEVVQVTHPDSGGRSGHRFPQFLSDQRHFVFFIGDGPTPRGIYLGSLDSPEIRLLFESEDSVSAGILPSGDMLFIRKGTVFSVPLNARTFTPEAKPRAVAEQAGFLSASAAGTFAYRRGTVGPFRQLVWFDRKGKQVGEAGPPDLNVPADPELSPDEHRLLVGRRIGGNDDVWIFDLMRNLLTRFSFDPGIDNLPIWSPDGRRIAFTSNRLGPNDIYLKAVEGNSPEELLFASREQKALMDWSADGRYIIFRVRDPKTGYDLWALPMPAATKPFPVVNAAFDQREGQLSHDGRWLAYQSNESGRYEIYVQRFPAGGGRVQVSTDGGVQPRWRRDGSELFYIDGDGALVAVTMRPAASGAMDVGTATPLFTPRLVFGVLPTFRKQQYAVSADGQRFLVNIIVDDATPPPITIAMNWKRPTGRSE